MNLFFLLLVFISINFVVASTNNNQKNEGLHESNFAVILSSSRYWFNYRHVVNALSIYKLLKRNGFKDSNIILMLADEIPGNGRNPIKNKMFSNGQSARGDSNLMEPMVEIDYRGDEVTVSNLEKVLLGISSSSSSNNNARVLTSNRASNVIMYWTGHGGDEFFKFQDVEEITAQDIARILPLVKCKQLLFIADTCQAFTLGNAIQVDAPHLLRNNLHPNNATSSPRIYMIGSSLRNENSYASHSDYDLGLSVIERYTHQIVQFLQQRPQDLSLQQTLVNHIDPRQQYAHVGVKQPQSLSLDKIPTRDFFTNIEETTNKQYRKQPKIKILPHDGDDEDFSWSDMPQIIMSSSASTKQEKHLQEPRVKSKNDFLTLFFWLTSTTAAVGLLAIVSHSQTRREHT